MSRLKKSVMRDLKVFGHIKSRHLWKDEVGDIIILTKHMEIYVFNKSTLGCYCWHRKTYLQLQKSGLIFDIYETDDRLIMFKINRTNLNHLLVLGGFKRRPHQKGGWIQSKQKLLGHQYYPVTISPLTFSHGNGTSENSKGKIS